MNHTHPLSLGVKHVEGVIEKLLDRITPVLVIAPLGECWVWVARTNRNGYGRMHYEGSEKMAHRLCYEACIGPIPEDHLLDHLCRTRCCINPAHLEPVTHSENTLRGKAKLFGRDLHPFTLEEITA
jgi:hypothetical protein